MSLYNGVGQPFPGSQAPSAPSNAEFLDRRHAETGGQQHAERRQFGSSHSRLSHAGRELAVAIDAYKVKYHRRYLTCDEMLAVMTELGYRKANA